MSKKNIIILCVLLFIIVAGTLVCLDEINIRNAKVGDLKTSATQKDTTDINADICESTPSGEYALSVDFIDVGQGMAALVESQGRFALFDGGPGASASKLVSFLGKRGVKDIDLIILSHYDHDHLGGVVGVLASRKFTVGTIWEANYVPESTNTYERYKTEKRTANKIETPKQGEAFVLGDATITLLSDNSYKGGNLSGREENNASLITRIDCRGRRFLFPGDAAFETENALLKSGADIKADVLDVGHHGSMTSSGEEWLKEIGAKYSIVSCGFDNDSGHPAPSTVARLEKSGAKILRIDELGGVRFVVLPDGTLQREKNLD